MVEWIEIDALQGHFRLVLVSTLVVEWIEILMMIILKLYMTSLHPRGGVD